MCGICGKTSCGHEPIESALIEKMCRTVVCRGPDDRGIYIGSVKTDNLQEVHVGLGHQRLSVIDLSQAGHQPMSNETGTLWITYNGEIYNFKELKKELKKKGHVFKSDTDTEVILHLYEEEGVQAVKKLNGMFAFALWDEDAAQLWVCRDRIGIKPLVYYWDGNQFAFASEIKSLLCDPLICKELDYDALQLYLTFSYIPAPYTIFKNIKKLQPGHSLIIKGKTLTIERYWDLPAVVEPDLSSLGSSEQEKVFQKKLYDALDDSVKARLIADVPLGAFLSGGIDSSIIVALMSKHATKAVQTFSIGFEDAGLYDETHYARKVARRYKTDHHEFKLTYKDMLAVFPEVLSTFDEPFSDSSAVPTYIVSRETKRHVTVALSGDGGDELFAGYRSYLGYCWHGYYQQIPAPIRKKMIEPIIWNIPDSRDVRPLEYVRRIKKFIRSTRGSFPERMLALKEVFSSDVRRQILIDKGRLKENISLKHVQGLLGKFNDDVINKILYADIRDSLPCDMLTKVDWMSMKNSLEVRVPFLDHHVVELAFKIPGSLKLSKGRTKYILKETFKHMLPESLQHRSKAGFEIPISKWLKTDLMFLLDQYLEEGRIKHQGIFDSNVIENLIKSHKAGRTDTSWMLWNLIVFQYWYDSYLK